jgi:hypothetical protein
MLNEYLGVCADQMIERGRLLLAKIPRSLPVEYGALVELCRMRLNASIGDFRRLKQSLNDTRVPISVHQRLFRRAVGELDLVEMVGIVALARAEKDDHRLTALLREICAEIRYPRTVPVVTTLSRQYFHIFPAFNLLFVPLTEGYFLLHLPDLYHELGHPLLADENDPVVEPFKVECVTTAGEAHAHFVDERIREERGRGPREIPFLLDNAGQSWLWYWGVEFFCDLFAVATLGPAFPWAHLHLHAKRGRDPYEVPLKGPTSHPADAARMYVMLSALKRLGFDSEFRDIAARWEELLRNIGAAPQPEYHRCYPQALLERCVERGLQGVRNIGCRVAGPGTADRVHTLLNEAWRRLWCDAAAYVQWERSAVESLLNVNAAPVR